MLTPETSSVTVTDLEVGQGPLIQDFHNITMWYLCKIVETGHIYQSTMTMDGPPVELSRPCSNLSLIRTS